MEFPFAEIVTFTGSFATAIGAIILNDAIRKRREISSTIDSLIVELKSNQDYLKKNNMPSIDLPSTFKQPTDRFNINLKTVDVGAYDSTIFSGTLRHLKPETRTLLTEVYEVIKMTNKLGWKLHEIITAHESPRTQDFIDNVKNYGDKIDEMIKKTEEKLPSLIEHLKTEKNNRFRIVRIGRKSTKLT